MAKATTIIPAVSAVISGLLITYINPWISYPIIGIWFVVMLWVTWSIKSIPSWKEYKHSFLILIGVLISITGEVCGFLLVISIPILVLGFGPYYLAAENAGMYNEISPDKYQYLISVKEEYDLEEEIKKALSNGKITEIEYRRVCNQVRKINRQRAKKPLLN